MSAGPTRDETVLFDDISALADEVWDKSKDIAGTFADPKFIAAVLFRRLRTHHNGYAILRKNGYRIEAEIIVRAGVETAICIAANFKMGTEFPRLVRRDAAATLQSQKGSIGRETIQTWSKIVRLPCATYRPDL